MGSSTGDSVPESRSAPTAPSLAQATFLGIFTICCWLISQWNYPGWNPTTLRYDDSTLPDTFSARDQGHKRMSTSPAPTFSAAQPPP